MKKNELRIGNWVEHNQPKRGYYTTVQESTFSVNVEKLFKPIPLTEEWLLKFGFEKKGQLYIKDFFGDYIGVDVEDFSIGTYAFGRIAHAPQPTFMNVHQLQNLYFALTGEELTINE
jgi:hypothetical protein